MRESQRLAYLQAVGVTGWVPRRPLAHAAMRLSPEPEPELLLPGQHAAPANPVVSDSRQETSSSPVTSDTLAVAVESPSARLVQQRREQTAAKASRQELPAKALTPAPLQATVAPTQIEQTGRAVAPFYMQLWVAGPCALLVEISDPGLEKGTPEHNLLCDILRAARLPAAPKLLADFRWPLSRNPQVARSAQAASEALQVFMQARLELQQVKSIGCFGAMTGLLASGDPEEAGALKGREEALEELGSGWFAPGLEIILREPEEKARLWQLLKRVMPRWVEA
ncbi:hypothetical protein [Halopseudomonas salina]|uniref:hypothetical protein n=1 Tax=Halopseudomonas salina TaxID=1323744 RepID=UPI001238DBE5|nr:hypothetical protein [Halopseudomonas salina]